jgi:hypothetical protein
MASRLTAVVPLTVSIGLLAFLASEVALNFTFHWVTVQDGVFAAYGLPQDLHLVLPALFVTWGLYFMLGANNAALGKTIIDNFVPGGKGPHTAEAVIAAITNKPLAAGTGAFGGLLSMSWIAVLVSVFVSLVCGGLLGALSVSLAGVFGRLGGTRRTSEPEVAINA